MLKEYFLRSLPNDTRRILAATNTVSLEDLATIADKIHEEQQPNINNINKRINVPTENNETLAIISKMLENQNSMINQFNNLLMDNKNTLKEIQSIKNEIYNINENNHNNKYNESHRPSRFDTPTNRNRSTSRSNYNNKKFFSRSPSRQNAEFNNNNSELCYYHNKFGEKAFKCQQPCTWQNKIKTLNPNLNN